MTIKEAGIRLRAATANYYDLREAGAISNMVLEDLTGFSRVDRIIHDQEPLTAAQQSALAVSIKYLQLKMPVQYILGYAYFGELRLKVNNQVLIPRPETEELVDWVRQSVTEHHKGREAGLGLLDIGTGTGCIPLSLKKYFPDSHVFGCDISDGALGVARHNSRLTGLDVSFFKTDVLQQLEAETLLGRLGPLDYIISNPPYIDASEKPAMEAHVLDFEPHLALFPEKSLPATIFYEKIAFFAAKVLKPGGRLFLEMNPLYVKETVDLLKKAGGSLIEIKRDLQGKERMVNCLF